MEPFGLTLVTAPAVEPVTLAAAKKRLGLDGADADTDVESMVREARALAEAECGRAFVTQTWTLTLDGFPCGREIVIPRPPLASVAWVKYYDAAGTLTTLDAADYYVDAAREPGRVVRKLNVAWPVAECGRPGSVQIQFTAGRAVASLDPAVASAILLIVSDRWDDPSGGVEMSPAARRVLNGLEPGQVW